MNPARFAATHALAQNALSDRQQAILRLRADGLSGPQIANRLHIAVSTVDYHERAICHTLRAVNISNAIHLAWQNGLLRKERHGDHAGFAAHIRRGETPCDLCKAGESTYRRAQRRQRKNAA
ncbi:helix-turn-helix transcriptional regulator [Streptomyces sp. SID8352]|uniref:response regulator transcription factor n=1 Tax=Streptomyces sp. SID8352 TaxID=2690338 RepID=UPI00136F65E1|nr:helix-turn-helix transcriptional regulator [Streptomyces sp. SID8352]MYU20785.1 hypothetical protein [Streptomyces sp. SID8352]